MVRILLESEVLERTNLLGDTSDDQAKCVNSW
jgi:hypothetical protein